MADIVIHDIDDASIERLESRASCHGRTVEAEVKLTLEQPKQLDPKVARAVADRIRRKLKGRPAAQDSTQIVRELRDS